jgi:type I restriction-modification system DNA methylase subunit
MNDMSAPPEIIQIVERFDAEFNECKQEKYGETQVRADFINPFFEALGWDMSNKARREITHEYSLDDQLTKIRPDYCFNAGGEGKTFFLEAKKPSVNLEKGHNPALQIRRYSWTANHSIGALTDFEELSVYYGRGIEPKSSDGPDVARLFYCNFREYADKWDEIHAMFSRQAVLDGSLERHAAAMKTKRGSQEVDTVFLNDIEAWRLLLAGHIASNNPALTQRELNALVQQTIDRIIFLRICEDRDIEPYGTLEKLLSGESVYQQLVRLFKSADSKYNSGLFYFKNDTKRRGSADTLALDLKIQDEPLKQIIQRLYFPHGPYAFSVMPADILGQVYERFLGKAIQVQPDRSVVVEEKPEVRKAGGVYYTPTYIVDYIVRSTVGKLVEGKAPDDISSMRVLDPACGSGSFLIRAYQYLLDWHLDWYLNNDPPKHIKCKPPKLYQDSNDRWHLAIHERKRILLNNIYGVDIDSQAVEVSKLSLLLKVLEGENSQSMTRQLSLFKERALPDLGDNIKCGNSLIGRDFYSGQQSLLTLDEKLRINAFDWETEFAVITNAGGFDAVIGNPPWGAGFTKEDEKYVKRSYVVAKTSAIDSYALFIERGVNVLRKNGLIGFITPDTFLRKRELLPIRSFLLNKTKLVELIETGPVFSQVRDTWCLVFSATKEIPNNNFKIRHRKISRFITAAEERLALFANKNWTMESEVSQEVWIKNPEFIIGYLASEAEQGIINKIEKHHSLAEQQDKYKISRGEEGSKYALTSDPCGTFFMVIPQNIERYFFTEGMQINEETLTNTKTKSLYCHPKIWIIRIQKMRWKQRIVCAFDERINSAGMKTLQVVVSPTDNVNILKYLSAILSSKLINFWCINYLADDMNQAYLSRIPIPVIDFSDPTDISRHEQMVTYAQNMLNLHKQYSIAREKQEIEELKRDIAFTYNKIDRLVYELYDLTDDEIAIVEKK